MRALAEKKSEESTSAWMSGRAKLMSRVSLRLRPEICTSRVSAWRPPNGKTEVTMGPRSGRLTSPRAPAASSTKNQNVTPMVLMVRSHSRLSADQNSPLLQKLLPEPASLASYRAREYVSGDIVCSQERKQCQEQSQQVLKGKSWKILAHYKGGVGGPSVFQRHVRHRTSPCTPFEGGIISFIGG